jgi:predicted nucleotidyltransferase
MATRRKTKVKGLEEIREIIRQHRPELKSQYHVEKIGVFGSYARGTQKKRSDVDFLVTFDKAVSLFEHAGLYVYLGELMGCKVDVVARDNIRVELRKYVLEDLIYL